MVGGAKNEIREADDGDSKAALEKAFAGLSEMLLSVMADPGRRVRISLDGAGLDNVSERLAKLKVFHRPLFTGADRSMVEAGPWLVNPYRSAPPAEGNGDEAQPLDKAGLSASAARLEALLAEIGPSPFAVFWVGGPAFGDAELYRHLRTLNKVLVPIESAVRSDVDAAVDATHEAVLFRHADGNVLAQVLPVLDEAQTRRFYGPSAGAAFLSPDYPDPQGSPARRCRRPQSTATPRPGLLTLSADQIAAIEAMRLIRMKRRLTRYLRKVTGNELENVPASAVVAHVDESVRTATGFGFRKEASWRRWTYLMFLTRGRISHSPQIASFIRRGTVPANAGIDDAAMIPASADERMTAAMRFAIEDLKRQRPDPGGRHR